MSVGLMVNNGLDGLQVRCLLVTGLTRCTGNGELSGRRYDERTRSQYGKTLRLRSWREEVSDEISFHKVAECDDSQAIPMPLVALFVCPIPIESVAPTTI